MTCKRWCCRMVFYGLVYLGYLYATVHVRSALGMVILLALYVAGFLALVDTVDLLFGRWIRRGKRRVPQVVVMPVMLVPGPGQAVIKPWVVMSPEQRGHVFISGPSRPGRSQFHA